MIDYNKLFDVAYSDTIPESVKDSIFNNVLESVGAELNESLEEEGSRYVVYINSLVESDMSLDTINSILDKTFESLSEAIINEVSDAWKKQKATDYINRREGELNKMVKPQKSLLGADKSPVGLAGLKRNKLEADVARGKDFIKANEPKEVKPSALDKLKSAVGKVKSWVEKAKASNNKPVGLSGFKSSNPSTEEIKKSNQEIRDHAVKMATATNMEQGKGPQVTQPTTQKQTGKKKTTASTGSKQTGKKTTTSSSKKSSNIVQTVAQAEEPKHEQEKELVPVAPKRRGRPKKQK